MVNNTVFNFFGDSFLFINIEVMLYSFDREIRVEYYDTDKMGVVHNSVYFLYFEKGRTETMRHLGFPYNEIEQRGVMMPLVDQYCKYISPSYYDDVLTIRTFIDEMPCSKFNFRYEIFRKEENNRTTIIAKGYNSLAFVDLKTNRPIRPPEWMTKILKEKLGK